MVSTTQTKGGEALSSQQDYSVTFPISAPPTEIDKRVAVCNDERWGIREFALHGQREHTKSPIATALPRERAERRVCGHEGDCCPCWLDVCVPSLLLPCRSKDVPEAKQRRRHCCSLQCALKNNKKNQTHSLVRIAPRGRERESRSLVSVVVIIARSEALLVSAPKTAVDKLLSGVSACLDSKPQWRDPLCNPRCMAQKAVCSAVAGRAMQRDALQQLCAIAAQHTVAAWLQLCRRACNTASRAIMAALCLLWRTHRSSSSSSAR